MGVSFRASDLTQGAKRTDLEPGGVDGAMETGEVTRSGLISTTLYGRPRETIVKTGAVLR